MEVYVPEETTGIRYHIWRLVTSPPFENFIMLLIVLNTVLLMMKVRIPLPSLCSMPAGTSCMPAVVVRWSLVCCQTDVRKGIWINSVWGFGISKQLFGDLQAFGVSEIRIHGGNQRWMTLVPHNSSKEAYMIWLPYFFTVPRCTLGLHWRLGGLQSRFYHSFHHRMCDEIEFLWIQGKFWI